ncbi:hypothetical protein ACFSUJ_29270 [Streptomyces lusitanus]|uniref:Uncharacterized protein n=1 Tax=Streptomyces lusitanus TaxID=68232 RepID=A0ABU3JQ26_9ACTN|nr:hypothetical protein [Streptomyces lusitanus]
MTAEFLMHLDDGMLEYFRHIADEMVSRFGISRSEAVARINERYEDADISPYPDLMCHEYPEYWAYGLYYFPDSAGRLPSGGEDEVIDVSALKVRPAPPPGSPAWTLEE